MHARIAIVDDSPEVLDLMADVLGDAGYEVVRFTGEGDLVTDLAAVRPDAIILDLLLAASDSDGPGWDRLTRIRSELSGVPVLVCSADAVRLREGSAEIDRDPLLHALEKPFSLDRLEEAVQRLLPADSVPQWDDERDLVLVADEEARLVHASVPMLTLLGIGADVLARRRVADIVAQDPEWTEREWRRYRAEKRWEGRVSLKTAAGTLPARALAEIIEGRSATWYLSRVSIEAS